ncbi:sucrase ferredoxin [Nocardioides yefusunii]|uniref:Sucrase ferredoxin n=1 Tax=Nocardioides yefusunii TaxID=2500546 RepID=A0ABW1QXC8_9ACTN|nr:sucrase ferredoxin [Nocardioides yefusunii]
MSIPPASAQPSPFRCTPGSRADAEPMVGTAPTDTRYLLLEYAGAWGKKAVADSRLPDDVKTALAGLSAAGVNVMLVRRHGGRTAEGVRVFTVEVTPTDAHVRGAMLADVSVLLSLDLETFAATGVLTGLEPWERDLHLVCTNGSRDLCCAELGRPVAAAVSARWPAETWECTHLGGHRFSATLLSFPSAICLGRLDAESAVMALEEIEVGRHPLGFSRGRAGLSGAAQVAQVHVMEMTGLDDLGDVLVLEESHGVVRLLAQAPGSEGAQVEWQVGVRSVKVPRRQSCGDSPFKPATSYEVIAAGPVG